MKDWLTVFIVILILVILADGVRRMRLARRDKIRMPRSVHKKESREHSKDDHFTSELPNGGARVISNRETQYTPLPVNKPKQSNNQLGNKQASSNRSSESRKPEQTSLNLDESVPMLMESVPDAKRARVTTSAEQGIQAALNRSFSKLQAGLERKPADPTDERIEPTLSGGTESPYEEDEVEYSAEDDDEDYENGEDYRAEDGQVDDDYAESDDDLLDSEEDYDSDDDYDAEEDYDADEDYEPEPEPIPAKVSAPAAARPPQQPEEVLIVNVMSRGEVFYGDELLDVILRCGLRFGDMNIFHRYSDGKGEGELLFSMANMVKPGTFDLDTMDEFTTPGVSLFMTLPLKADSLQSFELMLEAARQIAEALNGDLKDEQRSVMTRQTLEHCRERIREFERRRLAH